jgi:hypothetical protein
MTLTVRKLPFRRDNKEINITFTTNNNDNNIRCIAGNEIKAVDDDYTKNCFCP